MSPQTSLRTIFLALGLLVMPLAAPADAHQVDYFYSFNEWGVPDRLWQDERSHVNIFVSSAIGGQARQRVYDGAHRWDLEGRALDFLARGTGSYPVDCGPTTVRNGNTVYKGPNANPDALATTTPCYWQDYPCNTSACRGGLLSYSIKINQDKTFYTGTDSVPSGQGYDADLYSTMTHEFGHAGGFGYQAPKEHFSSDSGFCEETSSNDYRQTMCPWPATNIAYWTAGRTLGTHDKHTFAAAYPLAPSGGGGGGGGGC